jgi:hypothetical protein
MGEYFHVGMLWLHDIRDQQCAAWLQEEGQDAGHVFD